MGLLNQILQKVGLGGMVTSWLAKVSTVLPAVSIPEGWRFTGMYMVIFYAALVSLDPSVYEAAKIDGASEMQILFLLFFSSMISPPIPSDAFFFNSFFFFLFL